MQQMKQNIVFIGGGNMGSAILGGLHQQGVAAEQITVVDPGAATRERLQQQYGVRTLPAADASLAQADVVVWAVKPQQFHEAATAVAPHLAQALHISVAARNKSAHWWIPCWRRPASACGWSRRG